MKKIVPIFLFFFFIINSILCQTYNTDSLIAKTGFSKNTLVHKKDTLIFLSSISKNKKPKPTIVFVQGSLPVPLILLDSSKPFTILPFKKDTFVDRFNIVIISRRGLPLVYKWKPGHDEYLLANGEPPLKYEINNNLESRVNDLRLVVDFLSKKDWVKKDSIFLIGHSEGYRVAAKYCSNSKKIKKVACLSANPFSRQRDKEIDLRKGSMVSDYDFALDSLNQMKIDTIQNLFNFWHWENKKVTRENTNDIKTLHYNNNISYMKDMPFNNLLKIKIPILVAYGTKDVHSLDNDLLPYIFAANNKKNLQLKVYPGVEHNFIKYIKNDKEEVMMGDYLWDKVWRDVVWWFLDKDIF